LYGLGLYGKRIEQTPCSTEHNSLAYLVEICQRFFIDKETLTNNFSYNYNAAKRNKLLLRLKF